MALFGDFASLRKRMVDEQVIARGITDPRVTAAMLEVPRHRFVDDALAERAYTDRALPIGEKQTISQPYVVARSLAALRLTGMERVLEVGVGSGYQAAVLSRCVKRVFGIERIGALTQRAGKLLEELGYGNVVVRTGDGTSGWKDQAPFDAIVVAAGGPSIPEPLVEQLADGGRMVIPVDLGKDSGKDGQTLTLVEKNGNAVTTTRLDDVIFVPLIGKYGRQAGPDD